MIKQWGPKASLFLFPAERPEQHAEEEQQRQCGMCQRGGYCVCEQRKRGDGAFRTASQERKQGVEKERTESGVAELCEAVVPFGKGHAGQYAEGLPEYGKPAKGNKEGGGGQPYVHDEVRNNVDLKTLRAQALYDYDRESKLRASHDTPAVEILYKEYFG